MSTATDFEAIELAETRDRLNRLVKRETRGFGDDVEALRRICRDYGLSFWTMDRIKHNKVKKVSGGVIRAVRRAYISYCEKQVQLLEDEIRTEKAKYPDADFEDLEIEAQNLRARVRAEATRLEARRIATQ